jgi:hypothetical protein
MNAFFYGPSEKYTYYTTCPLFYSEEMLLSSLVAMAQNYTYSTVYHLFVSAEVLLLLMS